ncbi:adenosine deaminase [Sphingobium yanoikuyae]|uniref:adenosine deaminase n=1 Tax=Sphingobium yanoikuyae TaxID=13690 RepID=UPI0008472A0D|nr:adenosine deaminase [Sphingobium yanoikuyae]MDG2512669.1 adenosine deaminase [Sphingobium yanoikuyae]
MTDIDQFIAGLPKAELHLHIEGTLEPELMFALARRNDVTLPYGSIDEIRQAYDFGNLQDFLDIYYAGTNVLRTPQDFHDLAAAYFDRAAQDNIVHAEIMFDPQAHTSRGVPFADVIEGLLSAMREAQARHGITSDLILSFLRHLSEEEAFETLRAATPWLPQIKAVGLDSSEIGHPPEKFARVFAAAAEADLKLCAHAGEEGPPAYVWEALDLLKVDRIDHGNRALEEDALVGRLVDEQMVLTVCPLSNLKLCVIDDIASHPLDRMLDMGLRATVNSDDPAYFGGYLNDNYRAVAAARGLTREQIALLARNSITGSFLPQQAKDAHLATIDAYLEQAH